MASLTRGPEGSTEAAAADRDATDGLLLRQGLELTELAVTGATTYGRPDLADRLGDTASRLKRPAVQLLVVGEFKKGKSALVNALLDVEFCAVDDDIATAVPTLLRYSPETTAVAFFHHDNGDESNAHAEPVPVESVAALVSELGGTDPARQLRVVEVGVPRSLLEAGAVVVDTPGAGGMESRHGAAALAALSDAEAALFVTDASQELTAPELEFLEAARSVCPSVIVVLTKIDLYPEWRRIAELDAGRLRDADIPAELIPVSSTLRAHALRTADQPINVESGFQHLIDHLRERVLKDAERLSARRAGADLNDVVAQLRTPFLAERDALASNVDSAELMARLDRARATADALRGAAAGWQQVLGDGIADLTADLDHDLRSRNRVLLREMEQTIEHVDPAVVWAEFEPELRRRAAAELAKNYQLLRERADDLNRRVADYFMSEAEVTTLLDIAVPEAMFENESGLSPMPVNQHAMPRQALLVARGGVTLFGVFAQVAGLALTGPAAIVVGLLMGGKSAREERRRQLTFRREQATAAVRKYLDEVGFLAAKESRDSLRAVQRQLRDYFTVRASELYESSQQAHEAARRALTEHTDRRDQRLAEVSAELEHLDALHERVAALITASSPS